MRSVAEAHDLVPHGQERILDYVADSPRQPSTSAPPKRTVRTDQRIETGPHDQGSPGHVRRALGRSVRANARVGASKPSSGRAGASAQPRQPGGSSSRLRSSCVSDVECPDSVGSDSVSLSRPLTPSWSRGCASSRSVPLMRPTMSRALLLHAHAPGGAVERLALLLAQRTHAHNPSRGPRRQPAAERRRRRCTRSTEGQRTFHAQPTFSASQIPRAEMSSWPRSTPWRAAVGSACVDGRRELTVGTTPGMGVPCPRAFRARRYQTEGLEGGRPRAGRVAPPRAG